MRGAHVLTVALAVATLAGADARAQHSGLTWNGPGTCLQCHTGQAIEVVVIFMIVYLGISVVTSLFMNWFNAKMALKER